METFRVRRTKSASPTIWSVCVARKLQTKRLNANTSGLQSPRVQLLAASTVAYLQFELPPRPLLNARALSKGDPNCDRSLGIGNHCLLLFPKTEGRREGWRKEEKGREERRARS